MGIARSLGSPLELAQALLAHAVLAFMRGEWDESWDDSVEARNAAVAAAAPHIATASRYMQAVVLMHRSRYDDAVGALTEVRSAIDGLPDGTPPFLPPILLGFAVDGAHTASPRIYFEETVLLGRLVGADQAAAYVLCNLADIARQQGNLDAAVDLLGEARSRFAAIGDHDGEALASSRLGCLHRVRREFAAGREALTHSLRIRRSTGDRRSIGLNLSNLGVVTAAEGDVPTGIELVEDALQRSREIHDGAADVGLMLTLASVHATAGDHDVARQLLADVLPHSMNIPGNHRVTAWAQLMLADVLARLGRTDESAQAAQAAHALFAAMGAIEEVQSRR